MGKKYDLLSQARDDALGRIDRLANGQQGTGSLGVFYSNAIVEAFYKDVVAVVVG